MHVAIAFGTRPEIIKLSHVIKIFEKSKYELSLIHSNQHYDHFMIDIFYDQLNIPKPSYVLDLKSNSSKDQVGRMIIEFSKLFRNINPDILLVQGDTNTTLGSSLAANKLNIPIIHIEAGLRSFDKEMPEEINRIIVDHLSTIYLVPTLIQKANLNNEGITRNVHVIGNTISEVLMQNINQIYRHNTNYSNLLQKQFLLLTIHRKKNVQSLTFLENLFSNLNKISLKYNLPIVFPVHPNTSKMTKKYNLRFPSSFIITDPLDYFTFLQFLAKSEIVFTDSGGIQEEACILKIPCITIRENTERPETLKLGANILSDNTYSSLKDCVDQQIASKRDWTHPYGENSIASDIMAITESFMIKKLL